MILHEAEASHYKLRHLGGDPRREFAIGITSFRFVLYNVILRTLVTSAYSHEAKASHYIILLRMTGKFPQTNIQLLKFKSTQIQAKSHNNRPWPS